MIAILEEDDKLLKGTHSVYICPPDDHSDEDSRGDEDESVALMTRNQLLAEAEIVMDGNTRVLSSHIETLSLAASSSCSAPVDEVVNNIVEDKPDTIPKPTKKIKMDKRKENIKPNYKWA